MTHSVIVEIKDTICDLTYLLWYLVYYYFVLIYYKIHDVFKYCKAFGACLHGIQRQINVIIIIIIIIVEIKDTICDSFCSSNLRSVEWNSIYHKQIWDSYLNVSKANCFLLLEDVGARVQCSPRNTGSQQHASLPIPSQ